MNRSQYVRMFSMLYRSKTKYAECIKITRADGEVLRFTAHDRDLRITEPSGASKVYVAANSFSITSLETSSGLVVSNMDIDGAIDDDAITEAALRNGLYDNANIELFLAYWSQGKINVLPLRASWIGEIQMDGPKYKVDLRGIAQKLAQTFVAATSLECRYDFCDTKCSLDVEDYTHSVTVTIVEARDIFSVSGIGSEYHDNQFQWGLATFTSGNNEGAQMEILRQYENRIQLFLPLNSPIENGDDLDIVIGCSKTWTRCGDFSNQLNFGGEPFLLGNDILSRYPRDSPTVAD